MAFIQPSIEGPPSSTQDPWSWTVDQVVFAFTDQDSPWLGADAPLSLPDTEVLSRVLRENDVNGHALLTEVNTVCLRDELGIKSLSHRAAINDIIQQLQDISLKYQQRAQRSARLSSVGLGSRIGSPYFPTPSSFEPRAASRALGLMPSPVNTSAQLHDHFGLGQPSVQRRNILEVGPELQGRDRLDTITSHSFENMQNGKGLRLNKIEQELDEAKTESIVNGPHAMASGHEEPSPSTAKNAFNIEQAEQQVHQSETVIIDETGKKRRRLVLAQPGTSGSIETVAAKSSGFDEPPSSPETLRKETNANTSFETNILSASDCPTFDDEPSLDIREPPVPVETATLISDSALGSVDAEAEPGVVLINEDGRKRVRPILVAEVDLDSDDQQSAKLIAVNDTFTLPAQDFRDVERTDQIQPRSYGKKAKRKADQIYLGFESMPIDTLIYGDATLGKELNANGATKIASQSLQSDEPDSFDIARNNDVGEGQRVYVNARMKYLLRGPRVSLERDGCDHVGIIPYPDKISRKNCPLSITVFSPSSHGVTASRANRSKWIKDKIIPNATEVDGRMSNVFNVADPALARDESEDPEWKALEKWNYMDGKDEVLPVYGDSGSEGEYDLETWREIEKERGKIARPLGQTKRAKLSNAEVESAIEVAMEQIVRDWALRRLPKLKHKAWRLWAKSRRNRDSQNQIESSNRELERLKSRIASLREEISQEEWPSTSQINKQCKSMERSIFDREDLEWKIATLRLRRAPEKLPPLTRQPRLAKDIVLGDVLEDGEEILTASTKSSDVSEDDLKDFIVDDDADGDTYEPIIFDDDLTMADVEDGMDSETLVIDEAKAKTPIIQLEPSPPNFIDLTQQSDPVEPETMTSKTEPFYAIKTPPLYGSEDDSEIFRRSRSKKPVYRMPPTLPKSPTKTTEIISLESDSHESMEDPNINPPKRLPALNDVEGIRQMDPADLVERQDRKRLLMWMVAHVPASRRKAAFKYLSQTSMEVSRVDVRSGLTELRHLKRRLTDMDIRDSDSVMQIATWHVCWTNSVKVTHEGLQIPHIIATLEDEDGYEPFYDFLLECLQHCQNIPSPSSHKGTKERRALIVREDPDGLQDSTRKRKYVLPESQQTLDKRNAAQDRLRANEERRRRRELLKHRFTGMSPDNTDSLKVVVNPGKLADQDLIHLNPKFGNGARIKTHQEEGLQFLWREITTEHADLQGCLLAQTMGLGKTMQVIALLVTISEAARSFNDNIRNQVPPSLRKSRTLILCPPALVENWWDECLLWPPQPRSDNVGELRKVTSAMKQADRLIEIRAWSETGGVLLLGFEAFKGLIHNKPRIDAMTKEKKAPLDDQVHKKVKKILLERPTLVVADEAHQFKSKSSSLNQAMNQIKTKSRIALTGSPLNNNLGEYHSLIDWIAPGYLGEYPEFKATYEEPIREGLYQDSTVSQYRESRKRLKALELEMEPKVHRADVSCLHAELEGKFEFVITVPLTKLQRDLYRIYVENMLTASRDKEPGTATLWSWLSILRLLCNHPKCYKDNLESDSLSSRQGPRNRKAHTSVVEEALIGSDEDIAISDEPVSRVGLSKTKAESRKVFESLGEPIDALFLSHKTQVLMNILKYSQDAHNKVLVFSHSIPTLNYIEEQLLKTHQDYVRIDGKVDTQKRQSMTKAFNEGAANICLVSTRAGGQGLNLFGANRVVILDDHWNPAWELQAIGRAYRIGQQQPVFVYRLTVGGTFEQAIQNQALFKQQLATRVVDKKNPNRSALKGAGQYLFLPKTVDHEDLDGFRKMDPLVLDRLLDAQTE